MLCDFNARHPLLSWFGEGFRPIVLRMAMGTGNGVKGGAVGALFATGIL